MDETHLIAKLRPLAGPAGLNLDDDAALLAVGAGQELVISTDTMVEGVHFPIGRIGGGFAERLLRTALSDLAAKAARPIGYSLNLTWPTDRNPGWIDGFVAGLRDAQDAFDCPLIGGDTTASAGPLVASATVYGVVPQGRMVRRSGARAGDVLLHTGELGLAEVGLAIVTGVSRPTDPNVALRAEEAYLRPVPRLLLRKVLRQYATACADISDGLVSEAGHIAKASGIAIDLVGVIAERASFGDDYELLLTVGAENIDELMSASAKLGIAMTLCGGVHEGEGVTIDGKPKTASGYKHKF